MKSWRLAFQDIRHLWSSRVLRISVIGLMVLPLLYSFLYLWAFWNPTGKLNRLPLAVANEDTGVDSQGRKPELGRSLTERLTANKRTHWRIYPAEEARRKLVDGDLAGLLLIPPDFSEAATSAGTDHPRHPALTLELSQGHNMLGAQYVRSVTTEIQRQLDAELSTRYLRSIFDQVLNGGQGLIQAAAGADKLAGGTDRAYAGAQSLTAGLADAQSGMTRLSGGLTSLQKGSAALQSGLRTMDTMVSSVGGGGGAAAGDWAQAVGGLRRSADEAAASQRRLASASQALRNETNAANDALAAAQNARGGIDDAGAAAAALRDASAAENRRLADADAAMAALLKAHPELPAEDTAPLQNAMRRLGQSVAATGRQADAAAGTANTSAGALGASLDRLAISQRRTSQAAADMSAEADTLAGIGQALLQRASGQAALMAQLPARVREMAAGVHKLSASAASLSGGLRSFSSGFAAARDGITRLSGGAAQLAPALMTIRDGQRDLAGKLGEAASLSSKDGHAEERIGVIADPVHVSEINHHPVPNNGTGFAPYFIALSLWFGSLVLFFVVDIHKVHARGSHPISYFVSKYFALASVSLAQAVISVFVLHTALGLTTRLPPIQLYSLAIVTGLSFSAILFLLIGVFGSDKGRFLSVVVLMLQLTSSGGSYPVQMTPSLIRWLHPYLPMTYAVEGFRQVISVGDAASLTRDMLVLAGFGAGSLVLLYVLKRRSIARDMREAASPA